MSFSTKFTAKFDAIADLGNKAFNKLEGNAANLGPGLSNLSSKASHLQGKVSSRVSSMSTSMGPRMNSLVSRMSSAFNASAPNLSSPDSPRPHGPGFSAPSGPTLKPFVPQRPATWSPGVSASQPWAQGPGANAKPFSPPATPHSKPGTAFASQPWSQDPGVGAKPFSPPATAQPKPQRASTEPRPSMSANSPWSQEPGFSNASFSQPSTAPSTPPNEPIFDKSEPFSPFMSSPNTAGTSASSTPQQGAGGQAKMPDAKDFQNNFGRTGFNSDRPASAQSRPPIPNSLTPGGGRLTANSQQPTADRPASAQTRPPIPSSLTPGGGRLAANSQQLTAAQPRPKLSHQMSMPSISTTTTGVAGPRFDLQPMQVGASQKAKFSNVQQMNSHYHGEEFGKVFPTSVKYLNSEERKAYEVTIKDGLLIDANGKPVDTREASTAFANNKGRAIFVMDPHGKIYLSNDQTVGKFHHSSFLGGGVVAAAGDIRVENGKIVTMSRKSGHYRPTEAQLKQFADHVYHQGANGFTIDPDIS